MRQILATPELFKEQVQLWERKGHDNVIRAEFNKRTIDLHVIDYIDPSIEYYLNVMPSELSVK